MPDDYTSVLCTACSHAKDPIKLLHFKMNDFGAPSGQIKNLIVADQN